MRAAVYSGTRNVYKDMSRACKSLLASTDVDKVYFLIEDSKFPEVLPSFIKVVNVSKQKYFKPGGPNFSTRWGYMVLLRAAYPKMFEQLDEIVSFDIDTTVVSSAFELFNVPLEDNYIAGVAEPFKEKDGEPYLNNGVLVMNLAKIRGDGLDTKCIQMLSEKKYPFCEQDVFNEVFAGKKLVLDPKYNINKWTRNSGKTVIRHFAAEQNWKEKEIVAKWDRVPWLQFEKKGKYRG